MGLQDEKPRMEGMWAKGDVKDEDTKQSVAQLHYIRTE